MQEFHQVQRHHCFYRKSLSCKLLEMGRGLEEVVLFIPLCSGLLLETD